MIPAIVAIWPRVPNIIGLTYDTSPTAGEVWIWRENSWRDVKQKQKLPDLLFIIDCVLVTTTDVHVTSQVMTSTDIPLWPSVWPLQTYLWQMNLVHPHPAVTNPENCTQINDVEMASGTCFCGGKLHYSLPLENIWGKVKEETFDAFNFLKEEPSNRTEIECQNTVQAWSSKTIWQTLANTLFPRY